MRHSGIAHLKSRINWSAGGPRPQRFGVRFDFGIPEVLPRQRAASRDGSRSVKSLSVMQLGKDLRDAFFQCFPIGGRGLPTAAEAKHLRQFERLEAHRR